MAADEPVWLKHPDLPKGEPWPCPVDAVDGWRELGWERTDERPVEVNPVTAEMPRSMFEPIPGPSDAFASRGGDFTTETAAAVKKSTKTKPGAGDSTNGSD